MQCEQCRKEYTGDSFKMIFKPLTVCFNCKKMEVEKRIETMSELYRRKMRRKIEETLRSDPEVSREILLDFMIHDKIKIRINNGLSKKQRRLKEDSMM